MTDAQVLTLWFALATAAFGALNAVSKWLKATGKANSKGSLREVRAEILEAGATSLLVCAGLVIVYRTLRDVAKLSLQDTLLAPSTTIILSVAAVWICFKLGGRWFRENNPTAPAPPPAVAVGSSPTSGAVDDGADDGAVAGQGAGISAPAMVTLMVTAGVLSLVAYKAGARQR